MRRMERSGKDVGHAGWDDLAIHGSIRVNCNCTDFTDFTDCASASTAPRTRAEPLGARVARSSHPACPQSFRAMLIRRSERSPPLGAIREIASRIRVIAVPPAALGCRAGHQQAARHPAASPHDASTAGHCASGRHPVSWCRMFDNRLHRISSRDDPVAVLRRSAVRQLLAAYRLPEDATREATRRPQRRRAVSHAPAPPRPCSRCRAACAGAAPWAAGRGCASSRRRRRRRPARR
jgi:hypothetical protein